MERFPAAPWPTSLKAISLIGTLLLVAVGYVATRAVPPAGFANTLGTLVALVPPAIALVAALFVVRGYSVDGARLVIWRLLWPTVIPLDTPRRVWADPGAMKGSLRVFGNGGLFAFTGVFQNRTLGRYRAFVTDPARTVVLALGRRTIVVTPADPGDFVRHVAAVVPGVEVGEPPG
jgi:amino acid transporter